MASQPPLTVDTARVLAEAGLAPEPSLAEQDDADLGIGEDEARFFSHRGPRHWRR